LSAAPGHFPAGTVLADIRRMLRPGHAVLLCVLALLTIGVVMVNSADLSIDPREAVTAQSILLSRSTVYMGLAMLAMACVAAMPIRRLTLPFSDKPVPPPQSILDAVVSLKGMWLVVLAMLAILSLTYFPVIGKEVNNSHRWIGIPTAKSGLSIQPSEIAKWGLVGLMAWYGASRATVIRRFWTGLLPALVAVGAVVVVVTKEDLGTGALLAAVACLILLAAGARVWHFALLAPAGLAGLAAAVMLSPYRVHRLTAFLDPWADPEGKGYHMIQSMISVANGRIFGRGLGFGLQKFGYLPEDRTDFLFAVICEELGLAGAAMVMSLYAALLVAGYLIIRRERNPFLKLVSLGITATVGLQAIINLAVVTGLGPTKGIALPMLSSGGTGWILTAASLGVLVAIDRTQRDQYEAVDFRETPRDLSGGMPLAAAVVVTPAGREYAGPGVPPSAAHSPGERP
jgi:cell division protein FtsW